MIAAVRNDHYNVPDKTELTYQFISTYNITDNHMVRALNSKANRGSFLVDSYINYNEGNGVSKDVLLKTNKNITIKTKNVESLNVAVAGSIIMHEMSMK